jgi:hypothetical protein
MVWPALALMVMTKIDPIWSESMSHRDQARFVGKPKASGLRDAYDEMASAMKVWERERRELLDDQVKESQRRLQRARNEAPISEAELKRYKVVEVGKNGKGKSKGKVIEVRKQREGIDAQIDQLEAEAEERREQCKEDPDKCQHERQVRADLARGAELWEQAVQANFAKRRAAIEAEARKFQAALDDARHREEQKQAEKMGGKLDTEGNFVDSDLKDVPERPAPQQPTH